MNAIATIPARLVMPVGLADDGIDARKWRVLCDTTFPSAKTPEAILMAFDYCRARGLDVFKKPVHIVPMWNSTLRKEVETVWPGINEIQITAARTGQWSGMDEPRWGPERTVVLKGFRRNNGNRESGSIEVTFPEWCAVTVYRTIHGVRCPFTEPVFWLEAYSRTGGQGSDLPTDMWVKRPKGQLHKVAKAAALRAAFPEEGEYTAEEMEGGEIEAGGVVIESAAHLSPPSPQPVDAPPSATAPAPDTEAALDRLLKRIASAETDEQLKATWVDIGAERRTLPKEMRQRVGAAAVVRDAALNPPPAPPSPPSSDAPEPPASTDPEAWIVDCEQRMTACQTLDALNELWEHEIAMESEEAFQADLARVRTIYAKHEERLS